MLGQDFISADNPVRGAKATFVLAYAWESGKDSSAGRNSRQFDKGRANAV